MPSGSEATAFAEPSSNRLEITTLASAAAAAGVRASLAPSSRSGAALPGERFQTTSGWPARLMLAAIAAPILPSPMKATVNSSVGGFMAEHPFVGHRLNGGTSDHPTKFQNLKLGFGHVPTVGEWPSLYVHQNAKRSNSRVGVVKVTPICR